MLTDLYCTADAKASRLLEVFMLVYRYPVDEFQSIFHPLHNADVTVFLTLSVRSGHENR
jgi:hypothetical protein